MQMQNMNQFTSEVKSFFDHHKVIFINNLSVTFNLITLKENEYKSIECLSANTFINELFFNR